METALNRMLPQDQPAERRLLGAIMLSIAPVSELRLVRVDDFYLGIHGFHGWLLRELRIAARKPTREGFYRHLLSRNAEQLGERRMGWALYEVLTSDGRPGEIGDYLRRLREVARYRGAILHAESGYWKAWRDWDEAQSKYSMNCLLTTETYGYTIAK